MPGSASIAEPLVHILARLNGVAGANDAAQCLALNAAGRGLLASHVAKEVSKGWRYASLIAIETLCRTFTAAPADTERALLTLLTPERLAQFPHDDLFDLSHNIKHLGVEGDAIVLRLFEAAFAAEPQTGQWEPFGTAILPMRIQSSDQWNGIHYALADYYEAHAGANAALMTEAACIAWNAVVRRRGDRQNNERHTLATIQFRGVPCELVEDYSHIWGRDFEHEEDRIVSHFEKLLREWSTVNDTARLNVALDRFAARNRTSLMWTVLMEAGVEHPSTLGVLLEGVLNESLFLMHPDYDYGGISLLGALHKAGDPAQRERLEKLVLNLPKQVRLRKGERRKPMPSRVEYAQTRLLGALEEQNIVVGPVRNLWRERQEAEALPSNRKPEGPRVTSLTFDDEEFDLKEPVDEEKSSLLEALKPFRERDNNKFDVKEVERHWAVIHRCERKLKPHAKRQTKMAEDVWGHLVEACANIARHATWHKTSGRWITVRRILLKAAKDPMPNAGDDGDTEIDGWPSWSSPSPRIDSARGLPFLAYRLGHADKGVAAALRRLCLDKSHALRFNLAGELAVLEHSSPDLIWKLMDRFIANERRFSVLDALLHSMNRLWVSVPEKVMPRLRLIANRAVQGAPADNRIHENLAHTHLFHFLRTGDPECEAFIVNLIAECDSRRASKALSPQLHACRAGG